MGINTLSGKSTGETKVIDNSSTFTDKVKSLVDFYYPIFASAAANGWTTEYNKNMQSNENYVSDAIISGTFHLATAKNTGEYDEQTSLNYFITSGLVESRNDSNVREEATARYNAKKEELAMKESMLDLRLDELSTELESINTMMESVKSFIDDATSSIFDWGSG
jgi:hypothetical protein